MKINKTYLKIGLIAVFLIAVIFMGVKYGMQLKYQSDLNAINNSRNTILNDYKRNKSLAEKYLEVYNIVDESSYQSVKNDLYNSLSFDMQEQIFPTANYTGLDLHRMTTELISCMGTNNGPQNENVFMLEYNLKAVNYDQDITNLVFIKDGVIQRVIRIK